MKFHLTQFQMIGIKRRNLIRSYCRSNKTNIFICNIRLLKRNFLEDSFFILHRVEKNLNNFRTGKTKIIFKFKIEESRGCEIFINCYDFWCVWRGSWLRFFCDLLSFKQNCCLKAIFWHSFVVIISFNQEYILGAVN